jgi:hypothetical protein
MLPSLRHTLAIVLLLVPMLCGAAERTYAVLSLIGDRLMLVDRVDAIGSNIDRNTRKFVDMPGPALDNTALEAVEQALKRVDRGAEVMLLKAGNKQLARAQSKALDEGGVAGLMLAVLKDMLGKVSATHLILVSKHRGEARLLFADGRVGNGYLEGLGFYIDRNHRVENVQSGESSEGFLAPFAYFRIALIDLAASRVLGEETVTASRALGAQDKTNPWDALSGEQKVTLLENFIRAETRRVVPALVAGK